MSGVAIAIDNDNAQSGTINNNAGASAGASAAAKDSAGSNNMMIWIILAVVGVLMIAGIGYYVSKNATLAGGAIIVPPSVKGSVKAPVGLPSVVDRLPSVVSSSLSSF